MPKKSIVRAASQPELESRRAVEFVRDISRHFRRAGIDEASATIIRLVAIAGHDPEARDGLDTVHRVGEAVWRRTLGGRTKDRDGNLGEFKKGKLSEVEERNVRALAYAVRRRAKALGEPAVPAGRKPGGRRLLPLEVARDDREFDAAAGKIRDEFVIDDIELALTQAYDARDVVEQVANELHVEAEQLNYEDVIAHGAQMVVPGGSGFPLTKSPKRESRTRAPGRARSGMRPTRRSAHTSVRGGSELQVRPNR